MSVKAVEEAIRHTRQMHILAAEPGYEYLVNYEVYNRYITIDPIIRALGWQTEDPMQCMVEWRRGKKTRGWVDYALFDPYEHEVVLIEAKAYGKISTTPHRQLSKYLNGRRTPNLSVGVVTDGKTWHIFDLSRSIRDRKGRVKVQIDGNLRESARSLNGWLSKNKWW